MQIDLQISLNRYTDVSDISHLFKDLSYSIKWYL